VATVAVGGCCSVMGLPPCPRGSEAGGSGSRLVADSSGHAPNANPHSGGVGGDQSTTRQPISAVTGQTR